MGPLRPARLGRSSSAVEPLDKWRASGLAGANPRGAWWSFDRALSIVLSGTPGAFEWWVYEASGQRTTTARSISAGTSEPINELEKPARALRCDSHAMVVSREV